MHTKIIDANPDSFSSPAALLKLKLMITAVNTAQTSILAQIGSRGDSRYSKLNCNNSSISIIGVESQV